MSSLPLLLLLVLLVSLHACTARPFIRYKKDAKYHFDKELDKVKLLHICESCSSTSTLKEMIVGGTTGIELSTSFEMDSPSFLATKEQRKHARSILGPTKHHIEETVITNPNDTTQDIVEMDYAQPHRKPPIHNEKP
ncbi:PREDICTED: uncharacterized protein LOC109348910 [Lupinus angustifolius]|uniref:uncharacterized protein LOC109348910 n=1 Tax=Lupinus angustifolius TaxID=3871 RepID=UPI00092FC587|nr:PREDICTED: uncharacterized protein LOC109348910 [Lupinus angustifolius]